METLNKITDALLEIINGLSRFVGIAAPIAGAVGEATGNQDVTEAAGQAAKVAGIAEQATRD